MHRMCARSTKRALADAEAELAARRAALASAAANLDDTTAALRQADEALASKR